MRGHALVIILLCAAQACVFGAVSLARAEDQPAPAAQSSPAPAPEPSAAPASEPQPSAQVPSAAPAAAEPQAAETAQAQTPAPVDPVVAAIRSKLSDPAIRKDANAADLAALEAFYATRPGALWVTEMGFSATGASGSVRDRGGGRLGPRSRRLRAAAGRRAAADARRAGRRRDQARSRHSEICALRQGRAAQPARGERALRPGASVARSQDRARRDRIGRGA